MRLDKLANRVSFKRQVAAVHCVNAACNRARDQMAGVIVSLPLGKSEKGQPSGRLAAVICGRSNGAGPIAIRALCATPAAPSADRYLRTSEQGRQLNQGQQLAAEAAATRTITLIQGQLK